ncbi:MAG TPA: hypothetical protein VGV37_01110 [Aliidongia sp.]|uniref:hypothetical protein n=1 Tax=Aliidongia sp. TaxID=1914230 RepID=UPI002DDD6606|nr:hypothetical protein [Aliidongia sp.]HEV2673106.1 hypothetical protein [Aliidongia sp.]
MACAGDPAGGAVPRLDRFGEALQIEEEAEADSTDTVSFRRSAKTRGCCEVRFETFLWPH